MYPFFLNQNLIKNGITARDDAFSLATIYLNTFQWKCVRQVASNRKTQSEWCINSKNEKHMSDL